MKPINFKQQNTVLEKPENMKDSECSALPTFRDGKQCISCWELSEQDLEEINKTKKVYLGVLSGNTQPPVFLTVQTPFISGECPNCGKPKYQNEYEDFERCHGCDWTSERMEVEDKKEDTKTGDGENL